MPSDDKGDKDKQRQGTKKRPTSKVRFAVGRPARTVCDFRLPQGTEMTAALSRVPEQPISQYKNNVQKHPTRTTYKNDRSAG